ncbi:MAG: hypothetical protein LBF84_03265 [Holosporales bacterium]|jgi:hypothetical protein|nr:hypothetical protein [Holosporales bacterium]
MKMLFALMPCCLSVGFGAEYGHEPWSSERAERLPESSHGITDNVELAELLRDWDVIRGNTDRSAYQAITDRSLGHISSSLYSMRESFAQIPPQCMVQWEDLLIDVMYCLYRFDKAAKLLDSLSISMPGHFFLRFLGGGERDVVRLDDILGSAVERADVMHRDFARQRVFDDIDDVWLRDFAQEWKNTKRHFSFDDDSSEIVARYCAQTADASVERLFDSLGRMAFAWTFDSSLQREAAKNDLLMDILSAMDKLKRDITNYVPPVVPERRAIAELKHDAVIPGLGDLLSLDD